MTFSIIIPVYNVAPYLRECLYSVLAQTFTDWEAICVDDGSTDDSGAILDEYAAKDKRFRVLHQNNAGVVAARFSGFTVSAGGYVLFLDGDDELHPEALARVFPIINQQSVDIVQFGFRYVNSHGTAREEHSHLEGLHSTMSLAQAVKQSPLEIMTMCIGNKCYDRAIISRASAEVSNVRISHSEDGLFALSAFINASNIYFLNAALYDYKTHSGSASRGINLKVVQDMEKFVLAVERILKPCQLMMPEQKERVVNYHAYDSVRHAVHCALMTGLSVRSCYRILRELAVSSFFRRAARHPMTWKHGLVRGLIHYPLAFLACRGMLRKMLPVSAQA